MKKQRPSSQTGSVLPLIAVSMTLLLVSLAFSIDLGMITVTKSQLQNTADAAALAGAVELLDDDVELAREIALEYTGSLYNSVAGHSMLSDRNDDNNLSGDIVAGFIYDPKNPNSPLMVPGYYNYPGYDNSLRVTTNLSTELNAPLQMFLGAFTGVDSVTLSARATATADDRVATLSGEKVMILPLAMMERWKPEFIEVFYPKEIYGPNGANWNDPDIPLYEEDKDGNLNLIDDKNVSPIYDVNGDLIPAPDDLNFWGKGWFDQIDDYNNDVIDSIEIKQVHYKDLFQDGEKIEVGHVDANFDWIFFGDSQNKDLEKWISEGVNFIQLLDDGKLEIEDTVEADGESGFRSNLSSKLEELISNESDTASFRIMLLFDDVKRENNTLRYQISQFLGIRVVERKGKGRGDGTYFAIQPQIMNVSEIGDTDPEAGRSETLYVLSITR